MAAIVILVSSGLVILTVGIHLFILRCLSYFIRRMRSMPVLAMGISMVAAISGHLVEICIFAVALLRMRHDGRFGNLTGEMQATLQDYFYYSALAYTSLGFGDVSPQGAFRAMAAVEAITGLVLIAWTASFAFLAMQELWGTNQPQS